MSDNGFRFGDWQIDPDSNTLRNEGATATVEPKAMDVLRYLCRHPGAVIPPEELLQACWGNAELGDNPIHKAITQLRRALGDSASEPRYIETVRKRGYRAIAPVIATEDALEGSWQQGSPFRGLESFQESHAAIFFGRMQATAQLRELVLKQASDGCAMALVLGPSGSGKTSLVRAGLLPGLMASRTGSNEPVALACTLYMDCADLADGNLFQALAAVLMDAEVGGKLLFAGENAEGLGRWLESSDAQAIAGRLAEASGRIKIGLFVDRLEAIFRAPGVTDEIRARFIAVLEHLALSKAVLVMLACRNDFYPEVIALPALMALKSRGGHFDLNPPDGAEIAQMVRMPAKAAGLKFEIDPATGAALDDVLCDAARGSPDTLPLLQYCLNELYRQRGEDGTLRFEVFRQLGGIEGAIAVRAEQVVASLSQQQAAALPHILSPLIDVVDGQGTVTARQAAWSTLQGDAARALVQALVEARLFVSELSADVPCFGVAHEALLRRWPRVAEWIDEHRHALQIRARISSDALRWQSANRPKDLLIPSGIQVNQAHGLINAKTLTFTENELSYIHSSIRRAKFGARVKLATMIVILLLAILSGILGLKARVAQRNAEEHRIEAEGVMTYMLGEFSEKLRPLGKLDLLDGISVKALDYLSKNPDNGSSRIALSQRAQAFQVIAEINVARSNPTKAIEASHKAREILKQLDDGSSTNVEIIKLLSLNSYWLGRQYLNSSKLDESEKYFQEYSNFSTRLTKINPNDTEAWIEQSYAYSNLGTVALKRKNFEQARLFFEKANELKRKAISRQPENKKLKADMANGISWLGETEARLGKLKQAMALYEEEESILASLLETNSNDAVITYRLANALWHQGELKTALGQNDLAKKSLVRAIDLLQGLVAKDGSNLSWKINLYTIQLRLYDFLPPKGDLNILTKQQELLDHLIELKEHDPKRVKFAQLAALAQNGIADNHFRMGNLVSAEKHVTTALEALRASQLASEEGSKTKVRLANSLLLLSEIHEAKRTSDDSIAACNEAKNLLSSIEAESNDYYTLSPMVRAYLCLGDSKSVVLQMKALNQMAFRESRYVNYLTTHP